jgi:hypothetical protein
MQLTLLLPNLRHLASSAWVSRWFARGDRGIDAAAGRTIALRECFQFTGQTLPTAALTRSLDSTDAREASWLRADPSFVMADAVTLRLLQSGNMDLSTDEVHAFTQALMPLFGDAGFPLEASRGDRWYLRCPRESRLPVFSEPEDALGDDLAQHLPDGEDARRWRGLLNEAQIILHQHPANALRTRRGLPPVNSLWFWGAGALPDGVRCGFDRVHSNDAVIVALARLAKVSAVAAVTADFSSVASGARSDSVLVDLADQRDLAVLDAAWFARIDAALAAREIARMTMCWQSGQRLVLKPAHRWRFWRRTTSLA